MDQEASFRLTRGDLLPRMLTEPPGPKSRLYSSHLRDLEPPGVNTLYADQDNIQWLEAKGANILDADGNRYIDLTSGFGVAAVGHRHPKVVDAIRRQSGRLIHALGDAAAHPLRPQLALRLRRLSGIEDAQTYFAISGADAVEIALKSALLFQAARGDKGGRKTRRQTLLAFDPAYHGLTFGALAASSRSTFKRPFSPHLTPEIRRLPFACPGHELEEALCGGEIAAVLVEPIVGREGVIFPPDGWLSELAHLCHIYDVLLIADEIFTGFGRTGQIFAGQHEGVTPDLLICGKALAGGLPIGAVLGRREIMSAWQVPGEALHTATFLGHPLACAAALATLDILEEDNLVQRARDLGMNIRKRLKPWSERFDAVVDIRGRGLLWGLELDSAPSASFLAHEARRRGLLMLAGGADGRVAQIVPPLNIARRQLDHALEILEDILGNIPAS